MNCHVTLMRVKTESLPHGSAHQPAIYSAEVYEFAFGVTNSARDVYTI